MEFFGEYYHIFNRGVEKRKIFCSHRDFKRFIVSLREFNNYDLGSLRDRLDLKSSLGSTQGEKDSPWVEPKEDEKLVEIVAYCLNPNHYHLIVKEVCDQGVSKFIHRLATGYTGYFNKKYERTGALFQGRHKKVEITSNAQLLYLSAYVNANYYIHKIEKFGKWEYSSLLDYIGNRKGNLCFKSDILEQFAGNKKDYEIFCKKTCDDIKERRDFAQFLLE